MDASKLSIGAFGQGVATVQTALQSLGYDIGASELQRSFFGPVTRRAVQQFQKETGLAVSGKVDPQTAAAINAAATAARTMAAPSIGVRAAPIAQPVAPMPTSPPALLTPVKAIVSDAQIKSLLAASPAITSAMQARFVTLYDANTGSLSDFWAKLASDPQLGPVVPRLQLTMQLGTLTSNNPDLVTKLIAQFKPISMRDLTKVSTTQLVQLMTAENVQVPASIAATTTPATIAQYATSIVNSLKQAFPTDYVAQSFSTSTDIINQAVAAFLNKSLGFDFATTRIDTYLTANPAALAGLTADQIAALTDRLKSAQRVFRVINDGDVMQSLISLGLDSAYAIAATPSGSFLANYADTLGGQTQAQQIYANATNITGASSLIIRQAQENASGIMQKVIPGGNRGSSLSDALPNWQELFGATSTCQCCECRAIDGPAAYFVSLLQFLGGLGMNGELNTPLDVLIGNANSGHVMNGQNEIKNQVTTPRRPDLAHLKLNCANADTALPYVDLVNEILESYVANGSIGNSTAHDTPGDATTAVLDVTPEYTQTPDAVKAYKALNASSIVYPCSLPFDRYLVTVRTYLNSLGVSLYRLMQAFGSPVPPLQDATQLAAESLLISPPEYELITNQDLAGNLLALSAILADYFGYTAASAPPPGYWVSLIAQVPNFLSRTGLAFADLVTLLGTNYLNPQHLAPPKAATLSIPANPCDITSMLLQFPAETESASSIPTVPFLSPLPAFMRLWKKLGWQISELDYALRAFTELTTASASPAIARPPELLVHHTGGGTGGGVVFGPGVQFPIFIPADFILVAAQIQQLTTTLNLSVSDVVGLWEDIDTDGRSSPFVTLFQNKAIVNPPDFGLRLLYQVPLSAAPSKAIPVLIPDGASLSNSGSEFACAAYDSKTQQLSFIGSMTESQRDTLLSWANTGSGAVAENTVLAVQLLFSQRWYQGIQIAPSVQVLVGPFGRPGHVVPYKLMTDLVDNHVSAILAALRISASDLAAIRLDCGSSPEDRLSIGNLSAFHRYAILAQSLGISVPNLITLKNLTGLQPFVLSSGATGPKTDPMVRFVTAAQQVAASQFSVSQLAYLYGAVAGQVSNLEPLQATQDAIMATILVGLQNIAAANAFAPDPTGTALRKKLAVLLASTPLQLDPTMALISGSAVYTSPLQPPYPPTLAALPAAGQVSYVTTATITGSVTQGDSLTLQMTSSAVSGSPITVSYQVQGTDTFESIANGLAAQVNLNSPLIASGISATVSGAAISLAAPPTMSPTPVWAVVPPIAPATVSETVNLAGNLVCTGKMTDSTLANLSGLPGGSIAFTAAVQDLYDQAQDVMTQNLGFLAAAGPYSTSLAALPAAVTLPLGPVSFVTTVMVGAITASEVLSLTMIPSGGSPVMVSYAVKSGESVNTAAAGLVAQITGNATLVAAGISATVSAATISLVVVPASTPLQTWSNTTNPSLTETINIGRSLVVTPSDQVSSVATATIAGTPTANDTLSLTMTPAGGAPVVVIYVIQSADTLSTAAAGLAAQVNLNPSLVAGGISATASGAVITLSGPSTLSPLPVWTVNSPTLTLGGNLVMASPMLNSTRTSLIALAPNDPVFPVVVNTLYTQAWGSAIANLIDSPGSAPADRYDYVFQSLLTYLTNTQSRNLVKQILAQALALDPGVVDLLLEGNPAFGVQVGLLPSNADPTQSAMCDFLGGLSAIYATSTGPQLEIDPGVNLSEMPFGSSTAQWTAKLLVPTTGAYSFAVLVNVPSSVDVWANAITTPQSTLTIGGQPVVLYTDAGTIVPMDLTAGQMYDVFLTISNVPAGASIALQWRIAPAPLSTLVPIPALALMPCDGTWSYPTLSLLFRIAVLVNGFSMSAEDIAYLSTHGVDFAGTDPATGNLAPFSLAGLPAAAASDPPALFNQWQRLNALYTLKASLPVGNVTLFDVFAVAAAPGASVDSVSGAVIQEIAAATGWNPADISTLTAQTNSFDFVDSNFRNEVSLVKLASCTSICSSIGISAQQLFAWANPVATTAPASPFQAIAQDIQHTVKAKYDQAAWLQVGKPLNDKVRESSKDALINYILYLMPNPAYSTADDLYGFFLIDVEMCTCMETSRIVQASAAVQLFVQRCLLNLESQNPEPATQIQPSAFAAADITEWNQWRKNYRVWQAAVEVFLYPENWIVPELRSNQTPLFEDLVTTLLQGDVTEANAEAAFLGYLESLQQVARLDIVGVYTDNDAQANTRITHVIGRTFTTPYAYFYRTLDNTTYIWSPWESITADISGDTLIPVVWNRRLFLFWPIYTESTDPTNSSQNSTAAPSISSNSGSTTVGTPPLSLKTLQVQLAWSEYKSSSWTPKQITNDFLTPDLYQAYSSTFDPSAIFYTASQGGANPDGLVVTAYATSSFVITNSNEVFGLPHFNLTFSGGAAIASDGGSVEQGISVMFDNLYGAVTNQPPFSQSSYTNWLSQVKSISEDTSYPPVFRAFATEVAQIYSTVGSSSTSAPAPAVMNSLNTLLYRIWEVVTTGLQYLGIFTFDGPQGSVETSPDQTLGYEVAAPVLSSEFSTAASLYVFNSNQTESSFLYQNVEEYNSHLALILSGEPIRMFSGPSTPLPYTLTFPQQLLPSYCIDNAAEPFENVVFYADRRRTYFVVNSQPSPTDVGYPGALYFFNHYHPWVGEFIKRVNWPSLGISALLDPYVLNPGAPATQAIDGATNPPEGQGKFGFSTYYGASQMINGFYADEVVDFGQYIGSEYAEIEGPNFPGSVPGGNSAYSIYNWEIFFYIPILIAIRLSQNQQFDDAETWFRYVFDPTVDPNKTPPKGYFNGTPRTPNCYWNFIPFNALPLDGGLTALLAAAATLGPAADFLNAQLEVWNNAPFDPDVVAQFRFVAYQKMVVMKYLDHLIRRGDYCFGQNTRESINESIEYYILADQILGQKPVVIQQPGVVLDQTYYDLWNDAGGINELGNANVLLENAFPFVVSGSISQNGKPTGKTVPPSTPYFCTPGNPTLLGYYDTVADRLYKIRHCMNIQGQVEQLALFSPPINPALLVAAAAAGVDLSSVLNDINAAVPHYRFNTMMAKALELSAEVRSLGGSLLSAMEKSDAEGLALLRAGQEVAVQQAVLQLKQLQIQEANANLAGLLQTQAVTTARQAYYQGLVNQGLSSYETGQVSHLNTAETFKEIGQGCEILGSLLAIIPQYSVGVNGVFGSPSAILSFGGENLAAAARAAAGVFTLIAETYSFTASSLGMMGGWDRRSAEWQFQLETATLELTQIQQQINAANFRVQIATQDANNQNLLIANASAVQSTLQSKFTNQDLYQWMIGQVSAVFFQCYQMSYDLAKRAEACYRYELGVQQSSYIQFGYWDSLKKGLLAGEKLFQDLKRLEGAYLDQNLREYEISKSISLLLLDPSAFVALKLNGACLITLPEAYFDMDYPGHYMRRIRSVSLTIPCVTGPYTSVNCTLTLLQSRIRFTNSLPAGSTYAEKPTGSDKRFSYNFSATESIATSTAQNDSGLFEVNFRDERYLPFEGSGVISQWQLDMPQDCNAFDFGTITDLIVNLRYSARNGGDSLRVAARKSAILPPGTAQNIIPTTTSNFPAQSNLQRYFSLRHEYPTEWYKLMNPPTPSSGTPTPTMQINLGNERFPFQYRSSLINITQAQFTMIFWGPPPQGPPTLTLTAGSGSQMQSVSGIIGTQSENALVFSLPNPPQPTTLVSGGPKCWTLSFSSALSNVADVILICTFSVPSRL